jgi:hypothetical protein
MFERREICHNNASRSIASNTRNGWAPAKARQCWPPATSALQRTAVSVRRRRVRNGVAPDPGRREGTGRYRQSRSCENAVCRNENGSCGNRVARYSVAGNRCGLSSTSNQEIRRAWGGSGLSRFGGSHVGRRQILCVTNSCTVGLRLGGRAGQEGFPRFRHRTNTGIQWRLSSQGHNNPPNKNERFSLVANVPGIAQ